MYKIAPSSQQIFETNDTGKVIYRQKGVVNHTGIIVGNDLKGNTYVFHNTPDYGKTVLTTLQVFAQGQPVYFDRTPCNYHGRQVVQNALNAHYKGQAYNVFQNNCQHITSQACRGEKSSPDLKLWLGIGAVGTAALIYLNTRD